jgi:hypothetical protein
MTDEQTPSPTSTRAALRRSGAGRARAWRANQREIGRPLPRAVDAALAEATSFLLARAKRDRVNIGKIDVQELGLLAKLILVRDGAAPDHAGRAIIARLAPRVEHRQHRCIPSLRDVDPETIPVPELGWDGSIHDLVRFVNGRSPCFLE